MALSTPSIRPLPSKVAAQIESSTSLNSLNSAVLGLVMNSLDANAQTISITVDFRKGGCVVEDDGIGIPALEFQETGGLGKLYHTSKFDSRDEVYGRKGIFLPSLASLALVTISSRHASHGSTNSVTYHHSNTISRLCPAPVQHDIISEHGTRVTVTNLFGNLPVRVKHRALTLQRDEDIDREWDILRRSLTALLIASSKPVKILLEDASKSRKMTSRGRKERPWGSRLAPVNSPDGEVFDIAQICSILSQVGYINPTDSACWVTASARASGILVRSAISLSPSPSKQVQFISFGINPLNRQSNANVIYDEINRLFAASSFGTDDSCAPEIADELKELNLKDLQRQKESGIEKIDKARSKGVNRWPMFYVRIDLKRQDSVVAEKDNPLASEKSLEGILNVITAMIRRFLEQYHFKGPRYPKNEKRPRDGSIMINEEIRRSKRAKGCAAALPLSIKTGAAPMAQEEFLRPQVRIPNYSKLSRTVSTPSRGDFANWSRVKGGNNPDIQEEIRSGLPRRKGLSPALHNEQQDGEGEYVDNEISRPTSSLSAPMLIPPRTPNRSPTSITQEPPSKPPPSLIGNKEVDPASGDTEDDVIQWINPVTKEILYINQRTGQTLSSKNTRSLPFRSLSSVSTPWKTNFKCSKTPVSTPWIDAVLQKWENPVFGSSECPISVSAPVHPEEEQGRLSTRLPDAANLDTRASSFHGRLTKSGLANSELIAQVDNKFLLLRVIVPPKDRAEYQRVLVLVDQHAADERVRIERLYDELCGSSPSHPVSITSLPTPITFKVSSQEAQLFRSRSDYFTSWGCHYSICRKNASQHAQVEITALPTLIYERCRAEPKLAIDMLRTEIWSSKDDGISSRLSILSLANAKDSEDLSTSAPRWLQSISHCPRGIVDLLNSRACRSAIMFNDELKRGECEDLIAKLAKCVFPFHCAHGRPSMVPIMNLGPVGGHNEDQLDKESDFGSLGLGGFGEYPRRDGSDFIDAFRAWVQSPSD